RTHPPPPPSGQREKAPIPAAPNRFLGWSVPPQRADTAARLPPHPGHVKPAPTPAPPPGDAARAGEWPDTPPPRTPGTHATARAAPAPLAGEPPRDPRRPRRHAPDLSPRPTARATEAPAQP